ncbi:hypothetical protein [Pararhizobium qamdonense]|uniref:hypothetical protein n=1 Tax=Pararhizobium qamdonense TaxID=3031126 RepID=UPI0023E174DD|nr:hypothetical protein [Pararhizobium qamdonense]
MIEQILTNDAPSSLIGGNVTLNLPQDCDASMVRPSVASPQLRRQILAKAPPSNWKATDAQPRCALANNSSLQNNLTYQASGISS